MVLLLARSHYSLLTAPASPQTLCEEAVLRGHDHLALVDANVLGGLWSFAQQARRLRLRPVFGCEVVQTQGRVHLLARDRRGYESLCRLLSELHLDPEFDLPRALARLHEGTWVLCSDLRLLPKLSARLPRENLFVALGPSGITPEGVDGAEFRAGGFDAGGRKAPDPGAGCARGTLVGLARDLGLSLCAVRDVWFPRPEDYTAHLFFQAVKHNRAVRELHARPKPLAGIHSAHPTMHLPERGGLHRGHEDFPEAIAVAEALLADCALDFEERARPIFPRYTLAEGTTAERQLRELVQAGLAQRMPDVAAAAQTRLERELAVIEQMGFSPYFLVVREITDLATARGIPFVGRGSAADSLVAYALGLTEADPMRYGLLFERFLNPGRSDLPDIDLDFCWRRRDELLAAVYRRFGDDHVAMISTYSTAGPRSAYSAAAKACGLPPTEAAARSKLLPWHARRGDDMATLVAETPALAGRRGSSSELDRTIVGLAGHLLAAPRHFGLHPGGIVVTPTPVADHAPLQRAAKGCVVVQYDKDLCEAMGLVKIDLLGNRALTILDDSKRALRGQGHSVPELVDIPEDDPATVRLLQQGRTLGCFQVESPAMRTLLRQLQAPDMDRVIQAVALVRPGPAAAGMKDAFIRRARGLEAAVAAHPVLEEVFSDTFGIMLYQEDVIRAAMAVAGMDGADGDSLRRLLGKRKAGPDHLDGFVVAGLRRGLPRSVLEQVWGEMERFAGYSFCKAHAVTYGRLAFYCVYLKAHWPVAFLCAMLGNDAGYFDKGVYVEEAKRLGARFLPPCVTSGGEGFELVDAQTIRVGLSEVRGLSAVTIRRILVSRRAGGGFRSLEDFLDRVAPARDEVDRLIRVGALDCLQMSRRELLWRSSVEAGKRRRGRAVQAGPGVLLAEALLPRAVSYPELPDFDLQERTREELFLLGYALGRHPADVLWGEQRRAAAPDAVPCGRIDERLDSVVTITGWMVAWRRHRTENGDPMAFVTLEDGTGLVECTLFPKVYQRHGEVFLGRGPYRIRGVAEERLGGVGLRVMAASRIPPGQAGPSDRGREEQVGDGIRW